VRAPSSAQSAQSGGAPCAPLKWANQNFFVRFDFLVESNLLVRFDNTSDNSFSDDI